MQAPAEPSFGRICLAIGIVFCGLIGGVGALLSGGSALAYRAQTEQAARFERFDTTRGLERRSDRVKDAIAFGSLALMAGAAWVLRRDRRASLPLSASALAFYWSPGFWPLLFLPLACAAIALGATPAPAFREEATAR